MAFRLLLAAAALLVTCLPVYAQTRLQLGKEIQVEFHARVNTEVLSSDAVRSSEERDLFDIARRRVGIEGKIGQQLQFQVEGEVETVDGWRDVWVNYRPIRSVQVRAGQFKLPLGLEENTSTRSLEFVRRSMMSNRLAPGRDLGVSVHGRVTKGINYEVGLFAHDGDNARPGSNTRVWGGDTTVGRITLQPFARSKAAWADLQVGAAYASSRLPEGYPTIRGRSLFGMRFFDSDLWVAGRRTRAGLEARWRPGPFSFASELIVLADDRRNQSIRGADLPPFMARGWYASGAWMAARIRRAGSVQVAMRVEQLSLGSTGDVTMLSSSPRAERILGNRETAVTIGTTWRPARWAAIQGNLVHESIGLGGRPDFAPIRSWSRLLQLQLGI